LLSRITKFPYVSNNKIRSIIEVQKNKRFACRPAAGGERQPPHAPFEAHRDLEFEGCPFCRKVREAVSYLDLDVLFLPTPKDGPTYRPKAIELGGKKQFPYMVSS
jgi:hypothetical protein